MIDTPFSPLIDRIQACGPVISPERAMALMDELRQAAVSEGWSVTLEQGRPAIEPIGAASPYLAGLMRRDPGRLCQILVTAPESQLDDIFHRLDQIGALIIDTPPIDSVAITTMLRQIKAEVHLLTAMCDLGDVWTLDAVTGALSRFADRATDLALRLAVREETDKGRLKPVLDDQYGPLPGLFVLAMGKHGAGELNYSSDIDITFFCDLDRLPLHDGIEPQPWADRLSRRVSQILSERTAAGYVFRVDLRLRPDPSSTPPVVSIPFAMHYYESVGQNWERAAFIKARPVAGDMTEARSFMTALTPFVWRRSLDYPAIADVHAIKRQIHVYRTDESLAAPGANLKLGAGGIREIEFFAQTQQLILGGRDPSLRSRRTIEALDALRKAGHIAPTVCKELKLAYGRLRNWEHRIQMLEDEQTHILPEDDARRASVAALSGFGNLSRFDLNVSRTLRGVNGHYGNLFSEDEPLSVSHGSLVFTGVEDDPETLRTLQRMGFDSPSEVCSTIRSWHHGRIRATASERGRELFTRLVPKLLEALHDTQEPMGAFRRFAAFFANLNAGVQIQSLFLANPALFRTVVEVMGFSPRLARILAQFPTAFDAMLDIGFFDPSGDEIERLVSAEIERVADDLESRMNALRRVGREQQFRIGMQVLSQKLDIEAAGAAYARLADACLKPLAEAALAEIKAQAGDLNGEVAIIGLGKYGSQEMTAASDLDLMAVYLPEDPSQTSSLKGWAPELYFSRFTQKLITAISAPTHEGRLFEIDMKLRPSGAKGPVAVSLAAFENYYQREAQVWEFMALTRARLVWTSNGDFADLVRLKIETFLRAQRDTERTRHEVLDMRRLLAREKPAKGFWDFKQAPGGQVDCEFVAQYLALIKAPDGGPLRTGTLAMLGALGRTYPEFAEVTAICAKAWRAQQGLAQTLRVSLQVDDDPDAESEAFLKRLARLVHSRRPDKMKARVFEWRDAARSAFESLIGPVSA